MNVAHKSRLAKWGNSLAVRLPRRIVETARLREGDALNLSVGKGGAVVMRPAHRKYRLKNWFPGSRPGIGMTKPTGVRRLGKNPGDARLRA